MGSIEKYWGGEREPFWRKVPSPLPKPHPSLSQDFCVYRILVRGLASARVAFADKTYCTAGKPPCRRKPACGARFRKNSHEHTLCQRPPSDPSGSPVFQHHGDRPGPVPGRGDSLRHRRAAYARRRPGPAPLVRVPGGAPPVLALAHALRRAFHPRPARLPILLFPGRARSPGSPWAPWSPLASRPSSWPCSG